jgi:hypothetical protein
LGIQQSFSVRLKERNAKRDTYKSWDAGAGEPEDIGSSIYEHAEAQYCRCGSGRGVDWCSGSSSGE